MRQFFPVFDRAALVVDVRHNTGGNTDSWLLQKLRRFVSMFFAERYAADQAGEASWNMQVCQGHRSDSIQG